MLCFLRFAVFNVFFFSWFKTRVVSFLAVDCQFIC